MPIVSKNSVFLVAGVAVGFVAHLVSRHNPVPAAVAKKPKWEQNLGRVADLPWHTFHPALRLVNSSNLAKGTDFVRALRARQEAAEAKDSRPAPATTPEPEKAPQPAKMPGEPKPKAAPKPGSTPPKIPTSPKPGGSESFVLDDGDAVSAIFSRLSEEAKEMGKANPKLASLLEKGTAIGSQVANKYKEDEEFRNRINSGAVRAGDLLREARKKRPGGVDGQ